jgi:hypothetical protein
MLDNERLSQDNFNRALLEAIDEGFSLLGPLPKEALFHNLEARFQMKKEDIPMSLAKFTDFLETVFGSGTRYVEGIIMNRLCEKLDIDSRNLESDDLDVCVDEFKRQLLSRDEIK